MTKTQKTISPVDGRVYVERPLAADAEVARALERARSAQPGWRKVPLEERARIVSRFIDAFVARKAQISEEISWQMGRPVVQSPGEVRGFEERARYMVAIAQEALADIDGGPKEGFRRFIRREPLGVVLVLAPWNYPYLTSVNAVVPAIMAGNAVILKHSSQTPLCAERYAEAFAAADLPAGVFQHLHCTHEQSARMVASPAIDFVAFTGSVEGGHAVQKAASERFIGVGLELGGKDPAYVRGDADLAHAVENLVDGAFFNSGQSCCGIERIYAHQSIYDDFLNGFVQLTRSYRLGNPTLAETNLGRGVRAWPGQGGDCAGCEVAGEPEGVSRRPRRLPVHGTSGPGGGESRNAPHDRGKFRTDHRHHESEERRGGDRAHERQPLRSHCRDLEFRSRCRAGNRGARADRYLVHEPLRLPRSGARLDRRQGFGPRLHALACGLRAFDPAEVVSSEDCDEEGVTI
jgi:hypothetical protein